jgi:ankyrin repeat protein
VLCKDKVSINDHCENTPLHQAVLGNEMTGVLTLLQGVKNESLRERMLRSTNSNLDTPLMLSLKLGFVEGFLYLLGHTKDKDSLCEIDVNGNNLLHAAAALEDESMAINLLKVLMKFGPEQFRRMFNQKNNEGNTPLYIAASSLNADVFSFLLTNDL